MRDVSRNGKSGSKTAYIEGRVKRRSLDGMQIRVSKRYQEAPIFVEQDSSDDVDTRGRSLKL